MNSVRADHGLLSRIEQVDSLPTPPAVLAQINRLVNDPDASAFDIAGIVGEDPALTAKILRMANSAFYGVSQPMTSARQAIVIIGIAAVRSLVLCTAVAETFGRMSVDREYQDQFWRHSLATACAARLLHGTDTEARASAAGDEAFTAGLLHDIGKLVLACLMPEEWNRLRRHPRYGRGEDRIIERETLDVTHAEIGSFLARRWNFPDPLNRAIADHHEPGPTNGPGHSLAAAVHVGDYLAHQLGADVGTSRGLPTIDWRIADTFQIDKRSAPQFTSRVHDEYGRSGVFLQMIRG